MLRCLDLNNPGSIKHNKANKWQGIAEDQPDSTFVKFKEAHWGIRALARSLITYSDKHGCNTIRTIIKRWAPRAENPTDNYIAFVAKACGRASDEFINVHEYGDLRPLVEAIIAFEQKKFRYPDVVIDKALVLAGVEPPMRSLQKSRTIKGAQIATATTVAAPALPAFLDWMTPYLPILDIVLPYVKQYGPWVLAAVALAGIGYMVWARIQDRNLGLR